MRRVRKGQRRGTESGYIVTWDINSADRPAARRLYHFVFGEMVSSKGRTYTYPGFVEKDGVRYLGQSVLFVRPHLLREIDAFLSRSGIEHEATRATLG